MKILWQTLEYVLRRSLPLECHLARLEKILKLVSQVHTYNVECSQ